MQALAPVNHCLSTVPAASDASGTKDWGRSWSMGNLPRVLRWGGPRFCFVHSWITAGFPKRFRLLYAIEALVASDAAIELSARAKRMQAEWKEMS